MEESDPLPSSSEGRQECPEGGDRPAAFEHIFEAVYDQLRALARRQLASERPGHTLSATALVHEAYLRLVGARRVPFEAEAQYYAAAAEAMRRILVDHARARGAARRGGGVARRAALKLTELPDPGSDEDCAGFLILDQLISRLESADPRAAVVVRLRYLAGLSIEATARVLDVSEPTVKRAWAFARAWLREAIEREP